MEKRQLGEQECTSNLISGSGLICCYTHESHAFPPNDNVKLLCLTLLILSDITGISLACYTFLLVVESSYVIIIMFSIWIVLES